jgi:hypothetical protein
MVTANYGAFMSTYGNNNDEPAIALQFLNAGGAVIGAADTLTHRTLGWTLKAAFADVPPGTRTIRVNIMGTRLAGTDNDSYIDDIFLQLITAPSGCSAYAPPGPAMGRVYVDQDAPAYPDGKSWTTAYRTLRDALAQSNSDSTVQAIWIAEGVYPVTTTGDRALSFSITRDVAIYGGFAGTEELLTQRNIALHPVVLTGEIGDTTAVTDNSWHVVTVSHTNDTVRLDGLTITGGYADVAGQQRGGALTNAISVKEPVVLDNCTLTGNHGLLTGSVFNQSKLILNGCTITQPEAAGMSPVVLRNEGSTARLVLANTILTQSGTGATQGLENVGGAEMRITGNTTLEQSE